MKKNTNIIVLVAFAVLVLAVKPAEPANKDMVQLQTMVQTLQDQMTQMKQSFDERMGVMRNLVEQSTDGVNKMSASVNALSQQIAKQQQDTGSRVDQVSAQVQALNDSVDELKSRIAKTSKQLDDLVAMHQNMPSVQPGTTPGTTPGAPGSAPGQPQQPQVPPADVLYNNALRDYNEAKYDLATQEFGDYLKNYGTTDLAGNAQFYLADIEYRNGNFDAAVTDYDKVLEQYPGGNKTQAAQLKKGFALIELGQKQAGMRELNNLIARYPKSIEAQQARDRIRQLGTTASRPPAGRPR